MYCTMSMQHFFGFIDDSFLCFCAENSGRYLPCRSEKPFGNTVLVIYSFIEWHVSSLILVAAKLRILEREIFVLACRNYCGILQHLSSNFSENLATNSLILMKIQSQWDTFLVLVYRFRCWNSIQLLTFVNFRLFENEFKRCIHSRTFHLRFPDVYLKFSV